jgi:2-dehydropantoate 2-reductase
VERVCVVGAGVIGSLYAAHLARVAEVSVLTRREEHARALVERGLRVSGKSELVARVEATARVEELPEFELGILATKATELEAAAARLEGRFPRATLMTVQNGLGAEEIVRRFGDWSLVSAVTFMSGTRHDDAHVEYVLDTETWLGPYEETRPETVRAVADLLVSSGLKAVALDDVRPARWSKLIFNATVNGVAALTRLPHDVHFADRDAPSALGHLVRGLIDEGKRVAEAAGVPLHDDPWEMNVLATRRGSAHYPSMLEDVEAHRPTELELINGSLVREARRAGVEAPLQEALYALVQAKESSYLRTPVTALEFASSAAAPSARCSRRTSPSSKTSRSGPTISPASTSPRSTSTASGSPGPASWSAARARRPTRASSPPATSGSWRRRACTRGRRSRRPRRSSPTPPSARCRTVSATRRRSPSKSER